ncbi:phospholipase A1-like [Scaptodrosophila lebanonensis]|uniref:Phospholipase A1-like n=1 Tax=Drosophila lebanonensis TaxID=7225 RepID=A0A6J2T2X4_DROLE|nr:phospholipase A1-like [Scaptodrosophila lebanonensis]
MKLFLTLAFCVLAATATEIRENGENGWYVPQADGTFVWVDKDVAEANLNARSEIEGRVSLNPVTFLLYTKSNLNSPQEITASSASISASHFNPKNPTRFTIHGWTSSAEDYVNYGVRNAWFTQGDMNMITVDWGRARSVDYASSVLAVPGVGEKVAALINFLRTNHGLSLDNTMVIGHSLGAHVAGFTGKNVKNGQLQTIIGLDPALPLYSYDKPNSRLSITDAVYVESIQTNGGTLGFLKPIGKGAFYPNGGKSQPGCGVDVTGSCAHSRSVIYYAEAVSTNTYPTVKCSDYEDAVAKSCGSSYSSVRMGAMTNAYMVAGDYYVPVKSAAPYGMGA